MIEDQAVDAQREKAELQAQLAAAQAQLAAVQAECDRLTAIVSNGAAAMAALNSTSKPASQ